MKFETYEQELKQDEIKFETELQKFAKLTNDINELKNLSVIEDVKDVINRVEKESRDFLDINDITVVQLGHEEKLKQFSSLINTRR